MNFNSNFTTASAEASKYRKDIAEHSGAEAAVVRSRRCVTKMIVMILSTLTALC